MRYPTLIAAVAVCVAGSAIAQPPVAPQRQLSALLRQDASLRERIGRIQLDALIARVDRTMPQRLRGDARPDHASALQHDLDLYTF